MASNIEQYTSVIHPHPLIFNSNNSNWTCDGAKQKNGCKKDLLKRYTCKQCNYDLCNGCMAFYGDRHCITGAETRIHPHQLIEKDPSPSWNCDGHKQPEGCKQDKSKRFRCDKCDYDLCNSCIKTFEKQWKFSVKVHNHPVYFSQEATNAKCSGSSLIGGCKMIGQQPNPNRYSCSTCNFILCQNCVAFYTIQNPTKEGYQTSAHQHKLFEKFTVETWNCDGSKLGGCKSGPSINSQISRRFRCNLCDFDLCFPCLQAHSGQQPQIPQGQGGYPVTINQGNVTVTITSSHPYPYERGIKYGFQYNPNLQYGGWKLTKDIKSPKLSRYIKTIFEANDKDHSGSLDQTELYNTVCDISDMCQVAPPPFELVMAFLEEYDYNTRKALTFKEFSTILKEFAGVYKDRVQQKKKKNIINYNYFDFKVVSVTTETPKLKMSKAAERLYRKYDTQRKGHLSEQEFFQAMSELYIFFGMPALPLDKTNYLMNEYGLKTKRAIKELAFISLVKTLGKKYDASQ